MDRYAKNKELISESEQKLLAAKTAAVVGLGGLGGHITEQLARLGFGKLLLIDGDSIDRTNLNRQLFALESTLGMPKADAALKRIADVNPGVKCSAHKCRLTPENGMELLHGADIVLDAVDNIPSRFVLEELCSKMGIPLVHGSIGGWWGQVCVILPGDDVMQKLYSCGNVAGAEARYGNPAFTPALVASLQAAEALKYILGRPGLLHGKLLRVDLLEHEHFLITLP